MSDGQDVFTPELIRMIAGAMGKKARLFPCPAPLLKMIGKVTGKSSEVERLVNSLQINSAKIRRELSWTPPFTMEQGLKETAEWFKHTEDEGSNIGRPEDGDGRMEKGGWRRELGAKKKVEKFEDLEVWKEGMQLALNLYQILRDCRDYGLRDQMQRAVCRTRTAPSRMSDSRLLG